VALNRPKWRNGVGIAAILLLIAALAVLVASLSATIAGWPALLQALFYLVAGLIWIAPMKPLLRWMETGRFRRG
jgi:predicted membrane channel-forming protein YqfA (hemolysin III family)